MANPDDSWQDVAIAAFEEAIANGRLSDDETSARYAGQFVFIGFAHDTGQAIFKHANLRCYPEDLPS